MKFVRTIVASCRAFRWRCRILLQSLSECVESRERTSQENEEMRVLIGQAWFWLFHQRSLRFQHFRSFYFPYFSIEFVTQSRSEKTTSICDMTTSRSGQGYWYGLRMFGMVQSFVKVYFHVHVYGGLSFLPHSLKSSFLFFFSVLAFLSTTVHAVHGSLGCKKLSKSFSLQTVFSMFSISNLSDREYIGTIA